MRGADAVTFGLVTMGKSGSLCSICNHQGVEDSHQGSGYDLAEKFADIARGLRSVGRVHWTCIAHGVRCALARPGGGASRSGRSPRPRTGLHLVAAAEGRTEESGVFVGEAIGLMRDLEPAPEILTRHGPRRPRRCCAGV